MFESAQSESGPVLRPSLDLWHELDDADDGAWVDHVIQAATSDTARRADRDHLAWLLATGPSLTLLDVDLFDLAASDPDDLDVESSGAGRPESAPAPVTDPATVDSAGAALDAVLAARKEQGRQVWAELVAIADLLSQWAQQSPLDDPDAPADRDDRLSRIDRGLRRQYADARSADLAPAFVVAELAAACGISHYAAGRRVDAATALITEARLPRTAAALAAGALEWEKTIALVTGTADLPPATCSAVEGMVLPRAASTAHGAFREQISAAVLAVDADAAAARAARARRDRHVRFRSLEDAMGQLTATMPADDLARVRVSLDLLARESAAAGDPRTADQLRLDSLVGAVTGTLCPPDDFVSAAERKGTCRPGRTDDSSSAASEDGERPLAEAGQGPGSDAEAARGPGATADDGDAVRVRPWTGRAEPRVLVTVTLETLLGLRDDPAYLDRFGPVPATMARDLAARGTWQCAAVDDVHGTLLGLGRATYTPAYTPGRPLTELIRARDRHCTFPGCTHRAERCDLDHQIPFRKGRAEGGDEPEGGATCSCNLHAVCRRHHRLKTTGLIDVIRDPDPDAPLGSVRWTTRAGRSYAQAPEPVTPWPPVTDVPVPERAVPPELERAVPPELEPPPF